MASYVRVGTNNWSFQFRYHVVILFYDPKESNLTTTLTDYVRGVSKGGVSSSLSFRQVFSVSQFRLYIPLSFQSFHHGIPCVWYVMILNSVPDRREETVSETAPSSGSIGGITATRRRRRVKSPSPRGCKRGLRCHGRGNRCRA